MGDVCISLLLCDDLPLAHHLRPWRAQKQQCLGYSGEQRVDYSLCVCVMNWLWWCLLCAGLFLSPDCCYFLSERLGDPGQRDYRNETIGHTRSEDISLKVLSNWHCSCGKNKIHTFYWYLFISPVIFRLALPSSYAHLSSSLIIYNNICKFLNI